MLASVHVCAQDGYNERAQKYIDQYYPLAIREQQTAGVPASVTLAQGILETEAGNSELMVKANNHFGIKCKNGWTGETILHTDDLKDECFKKYGCAADSYHDHSEHLKRNPRYASLFTLSKTDYASWAVGLKRCGYATNPQYAQKLIKIIEDFKLQEYTYAGLDSAIVGNYPALVASTAPIPPAEAKPSAPVNVVPAEPVVATDTVKKVVSAPPATAPAAAQPVALQAVPVKDTTVKAAAMVPATDTAMTALLKIADSVRNAMAQTPPAATDSVTVVTTVPEHDVDSSKIVVVNGLRAVLAYKDDMLLQYAVKYKIRYPQLLEMNDLDDAPVPFNMYIYLQKKLTSGTHETHTVGANESLLMVAQAEGMQLKKLAALNMLGPNEEPVAGSVLYLQAPTTRKPGVKAVPTTAHTGNAIVIASQDPAQNNNDYIVLHNNDAATPAPADTAQHKPAPIAAAMAEPGKAVPAVGEDDEEEEETDASKVTSAAAPQPVQTPVPPQAATSAIAVKTEPAKPAATEKKEDLGKLKSQLDKVVYADESKLPYSVEDPSQKQMKRPASEDDSLKNDRFYTVKRGDTAYSIAKKYNITVRDLIKWNSIDAEEIRAGQSLKVKE